MAKLAQSITITLGGKDIHLVPRLRFAMRLERRPGSFAALSREIMDGSLSAACDIIRDHTDLPDLPKHILDTGLACLTTPLLSYLMAIAGIDPEDAPANDNRTKQPGTIPFSDHLANLYRLGTGWLGWTPKDTLESTPAEIMEAYKGRLELLRSIFGGEQEAPSPASDIPLDDKIKTAFASFNVVKMKRRRAA